MKYFGRAARWEPCKRIRAGRFSFHTKPAFTPSWGSCTIMRDGRKQNIFSLIWVQGDSPRNDQRESIYVVLAAHSRHASDTNFPIKKATEVALVSNQQVLLKLFINHHFNNTFMVISHRANLTLPITFAG